MNLNKSNMDDLKQRLAILKMEKDNIDITVDVIQSLIDSAESREQTSTRRRTKDIKQSFGDVPVEICPECNKKSVMVTSKGSRWCYICGAVIDDTEGSRPGPPSSAHGTYSEDHGKVKNDWLY